jgi:hypothetical protein
VEVDRVVRRRGSNIFYAIGSQMAGRLSALCAGRPLPPGRFLVLISVRGWVDPRAIVRLEGLGQFKNPITSSGQNINVRNKLYMIRFIFEDLIVTSSPPPCFGNREFVIMLRRVYPWVRVACSPQTNLCIMFTLILYFHLSRSLVRVLFRLRNKTFYS